MKDIYKCLTVRETHLQFCVFDFSHAHGKNFFYTACCIIIVT